jgi:hypothetical protein
MVVETLPPVPSPGPVHHPMSCLLPRQLVQIMLLLLNRFGVPSRVHAVELFAGCHSVTNGIKSYGFSAVPRLDVSSCLGSRVLAECCFFTHHESFRIPVVPCLHRLLSMLVRNVSTRSAR